MKQFRLFLHAIPGIICLLLFVFTWSAAFPLQAAHARGISITPPESFHETLTRKASTLQRVNASTPPPLQYHGGPAMQSPVISYAIFWEPSTLQDGTATYVSPAYNSLIEQYLSDVNGSGLAENSTQYYDTTGHIVNNESFGGAWVDTSPYPASGCSDSATPGNCVSYKQLKAEVLNAMAVNGWTPGLNHIFFLFTSWDEGSCNILGHCAFSNFCAYHANFPDNGQSALFADIPYEGTSLSSCGVPQSPNNDADADSSISFTSHEQMEAITDPVGTAWYDSANNEIGDKCDFQFGPLSLDGGLANQEWNSHYYITQMEWSNATGGCVQARAMSGSVYAGDSTSLYALNAPDGSLVWQSPSTGVTFSPPTVANGVVYSGGSDDNLYAFNAADGSLLWQAALSGSITAPPVVVNNVVYVGASDNSFYAFNAANGSLLWQKTPGGSLLSSPGVVNGVVYLELSNSAISAYNAGTGAFMWSFHASSTITSPLTIVKTLVYVGSSSGILYALNTKNGAKKWSYVTGGAIVSQPLVSGSVLYAGSSDTHLYAINATYGTLLWQTSTGSGVVQAPPAISGKTLYAGASDDNLYAFSLTSGALLWSYTTSGAIAATPQLFNGAIYVGSEDNAIYALSSNGALLWRVQTGGQITSRLSIADGVLYTGSADAHIYALWADDGTHTWNYATASGVSTSPIVMLTIL